MFLTQQVFTSIQRCFFNQTTKQDRIWASTELTMICNTRITFRMVAKGFLSLRGPGWLWMELVSPSLAPSLGWFPRTALPPSLLFQAVQDTPWSHFCSTSSTWMFSLNTLLVTQRSTEKSQIHGRAASLKKGSSSYVTVYGKGPVSQIGICPITKSFNF